MSKNTIVSEELLDPAPACRGWRVLWVLCFLTMKS